MTKNTCSDCKFWSQKDEYANGESIDMPLDMSNTGVCYKFNNPNEDMRGAFITYRSRFDRDIPFLHTKSIIATHKNFGCNKFEEKTIKS